MNVGCSKMTGASLVPSEYDECRAFHQWLQLKRIPHTHIGNESQMGGRSGAMRGARLKAIGQSRGFPDYLLFPQTKQGRLCIAVEMKRQKGGRASEFQTAWLETLQGAGFACKVCHGAGEAIDFVMATINGYNRNEGGKL